MRLYYDQEDLEMWFGHLVSVFNDHDARKEDGSLYATNPNTIGIYSKTYLWGFPQAKPKVIGCLSLPAPALDTPQQPHYSYYVQKGVLNTARYQAEMEELAALLIHCAREHQSEFQRLVIPTYGQGAFLAALSESEQAIALTIFYCTLRNALQNAPELHLPIAIAQRRKKPHTRAEQELILPLQAAGLSISLLCGDILQTAQEKDLIINPWNPHSAPGNGNDGDPSFDGTLGKGTGITLTQLPWLNPHMRLCPILSNK